MNLCAQLNYDGRQFFYLTIYQPLTDCLCQHVNSFNHDCSSESEKKLFEIIWAVTARHNDKTESSSSPLRVTCINTIKITIAQGRKEKDFFSVCCQKVKMVNFSFKSVTDRYAQKRENTG